MYGSLKPQQTAQARRQNMKFFDSTDLARNNNGANGNANNEPKVFRMPAYFTVKSFLPDDERIMSMDSVLSFGSSNSNNSNNNNSVINNTNNGNKSAKFGKLPINIHERNIRKNIKFFNSSEMRSGENESSGRPGYFEVSEFLQKMESKNPANTKLYVTTQ